MKYSTATVFALVMCLAYLPSAANAKEGGSVNNKRAPASADPCSTVEAYGPLSDTGPNRDQYEQCHRSRGQGKYHGQSSSRQDGAQAVQAVAQMHQYIEQMTAAQKEDSDVRKLVDVDGQKQLTQVLAASQEKFKSAGIGFSGGSAL